MTKPAQSPATRNSQSAPDRTDRQHIADLERHARLCAICNHPRREAIEDDFLHWYNPVQISTEYDLPSVSSLYRHARAMGLLARRTRNLRGVAERILERVDDATLTTDAVLRAMRIYAHISEDGQWIEPPKVSIVEHRHSFANSPSPHSAALSSLENSPLPALPPKNAARETIAETLAPSENAGPIAADPPPADEILIGNENRVKKC